MAEQMKCPTCGESYSGEEYCPVHGIKLRAVAPTKGIDNTLPENGQPLQSSRRERTEHGAPSLMSAPPGVIEASSRKSLTSRLTSLLRGGTHPGPGAGTASPTTSLPPELTGWIPEGPPTFLKTADGRSQRVVNGDGAKALYKRYALGSLTRSEAYSRIQQLSSPCLTKLLTYGHFEGADFELISCAGSTQPFSEWLQTNVSAHSANWFIRQCTDILARLESAELASLWFEPTSFAVVENSLMLIDYGKLMVVGKAGSGFLSTLPASQTEYAAAEIFKTKLWHANSMLYSVGAIAMQLVNGHAPTHQATECGDLDFQVIRDDALRSAIRGLLYPDPARRWNVAHLSKWADGAPVDTPDWSRLRPGAARNALVLHGMNIYLPADLAEPLLRDLDLSAERLDEALDWLNDNPAMREVANEIAINRRNGRSSDWLLLRLAHRLNPGCPRIWRGLSLEDSVVERNLFELGRRAMNDDGQARALVDRLQCAELVGVYPPATEVKS